MQRQSYRAPELVRRTLCCNREPGVTNGKLWCPSCGQQVLRAAEVFHSFTTHPAPAVTPEPVPPTRGRRRRTSEGQGSLL